MAKKELRFLAKAQVRSKTGSSGKVITGYAAMFNSLSENLGNFVEVIRKGAFKRTLAEGADVRCLFNHNEDNILGRSVSKTLRMWEDEVGLAFECDLPNTTVANDVHTSVQRGDIDQCSFGFSVPDGGDNWIPTNDSPGVLRELIDVDLFDVSAVTYPAYQATTLEARSKTLFPEGMDELVRKATAVKEKRDAMSTTGDGAALVPKGFAVGYTKHDKRSEDPFDSVDAANGIINWAEGDDENRSADSPVKNVEKASLGFTYVNGDGSKRSDYLLPHHLVASGQLAHSAAGVKQATADFQNGANGADSIPEQFRADVYAHLVAEAELFTDAGNITEGEPDADDATVADITNPAYNSKNPAGEKRKTKKVAGVDLPASSFAYVGDAKDTSTWKLPIHFPGDADKTVNHIKNALARFADTKGIPSSESSSVYHKIVGAAKAHGIKVKGENSSPNKTEQRSIETLQELSRAIDQALSETFGTDDNNWQKYYVCETYSNYLIVVENATGDLFRVGYTVADETVSLGELVEVEAIYVPVFDDEDDNGRSIKLKRSKPENPAVVVPAVVPAVVADAQPVLVSVEERERLAMRARAALAQ